MFFFWVKNTFYVVFSIGFPFCTTQAAAMAKAGKEKSAASKAPKAPGTLKKELSTRANSSGDAGSLITTALAVLLGALLLGVSFQQPERVRLATSRALQLVAPHIGLNVAGLGGDSIVSANSSSSGGSGSMSEAFARSVDCKDALQYLTEAGPVKGFHVVCIQSTPLDSYVTCVWCVSIR